MRYDNRSCVFAMPLRASIDILCIESRRSTYPSLDIQQEPTSCAHVFLYGQPKMM